MITQLPTKYKTIGIMGGNGFLGSNLAAYFSGKGYETTPVTKENYNEHSGKTFDIFINANGNSKRFWANEHPEEDYVLSVESVEKSVKDFTFSTYVHISSSDVYPDHGNPEVAVETTSIEALKLETYGRHKYQAEQIITKLPRYIILRLSAMVGPGLRKGVIRDILDGRELFVTKDTRLQFISCEAIAQVIEHLLAKDFQNETFNLGGKGSLTLEQMAEILGKPYSIRADAKTQLYEMGVGKLDKLIGLKSSKDYLIEFSQKLYEKTQ